MQEDSTPRSSVLPGRSKNMSRSESATLPSSLSTSQRSASDHPLRPRWFYAREGDWVVFSESDDERLEQRFQEAGGESWALKLLKEQREKRKEEAQNDERAASEREAEKREEEEKREVRKEAALAGADFKNLGWAGTFSSWWSSPASKVPGAAKDKEDAAGKKAKEDDEKKQMVEEILDPDEPDSERKYKVPVLEDKLFDVDLEKMQLYPVFFKGVLLPVVRATWFYWSEVREEYSPISFSSDLGQDLSKAWQDSKAWQLGEHGNSDRNKVKEGSDSTQLVEIRSGESQDSDEKAKVQFKSAIMAKIFSEDVRGRVLSLVGGSTVIRGFDEVERRTSEAQKDGNFFDMPDIPVPWGSSDDDNFSDNEAANQAKLNSAVKSTKKAGAAQPDANDSKRPAAGGGGYGSRAKQNKSAAGNADDADGKAADNQGFAASLWPSSDSFTRPRFAFLKALGLSFDDATEEAKRTQKQKTTESAAQPDSELKSSSRANQKGDGNDEEDDAPDLDSLKDDPVHLILVIHGIGQGLRDTFESLDFTWDVQKIRNLSRATAQDEGIKMLSKGRRVQYIPICWRRDLDFNYKSEENDNHFGLADVTNDATIPFVRNVVSKVILDVPYYLSEIHKPKMVTAVRYELNRVYRLFVRRNPEFLTKGGKVSIIGHSLGSCLATDILSEQPTEVPSIAKMSHADITAALKERLLFNTTHLFLVGSPLGLFLHLGGGQLIARRTSSRGRLDEQASLDKQGKFGCLAFSGNIYNCYNSADPVAYRLNGTVDQRYATLIRPMPLPGAVNAILDMLKQPRLIVSKLFDAEHPFDSKDEVHRVAQKVSRESLASHSSQEGTDPRKSQHHVNVDARVATHDEKSKGEQIDLKRYSETHDGAVNSLASRAARKANELASKDEDDSEQDGADQDGSVPGSGALSPVRLEEGSAAKRSLPSRLVAAHAAALTDPTSTSRDRSYSSQSSGRLDGLLQSLNRAEQRFRALNKHGCIDFFFEDSGSLSEYFSMLGAHNGYWTSASFVSLVLSQVFDDHEDGPKAPRLVPNIEKPAGGRREKHNGAGGHEEADNDGDTSGHDDDDDDDDDDDNEE